MSAEPNPAALQSHGESLPGFYAPLRERVFRLYWLAAIVALTALWMHDAGAAWYMRELTEADPFMVSLIQAAASVPVMLLSLPMGTVGDMWDRRRLLIAANLILLAGVAATFAAAYSASMSPWLLIVLTAAVGIGKAMLLPGLASIIPELVAPRYLPLGVGLHSFANNLARIAGPAFAGVLAASLGIAAVFGVDLVLLVASLFLMLIWRSNPREKRRSGSYLAELQAGVMFCVNDKAFRRLVARVLIFFLCAAALHALLPVIVSNPKMFGMSWSAFGLGAVLGAIVYPWLSSRLSLHTQLSTGIVFHALSLGALTVVTDETMRLFVLVFLGVCWFFVMSAAQVGAQLALPDSMRSRGMGAFVVVIIAGIGLGAPLWGMVARFFSAEVSLLTAMSVSLLSLVFTHHISVRDTR